MEWNTALSRLFGGRPPFRRQTPEPLRTLRPVVWRPDSRISETWLVRSGRWGIAVISMTTSFVALTACTPGDPGFTVTVVNRCGFDIEAADLDVYETTRWFDVADGERRSLGTGGADPEVIELSARRPGSADATPFRLSGAELTKAIEEDGDEDSLRLTLSGDRCPP
jgi:hypothetical protein